MLAWIFVAPTIFLLLAINIFLPSWTIQLSFTNFRANRPNADVKWIGLRTMSGSSPTMISGRPCRRRRISAGPLFCRSRSGSLAWLINQKFKGNNFWTTIIVLHDAVLRRCRELLDIRISRRSASSIT